MEAIGSFLMDQVLKMEWLSELVTGLLAPAGVDTASRWGGSLQFFLYDTVKIVILLQRLLTGFLNKIQYF